MSDKYLARRAETQVVLGGVDITVYVNKGYISFEYVDNEEDEADDLQIKVADRDGKWLRKWLNSIIEGGALGGSVISAAPESGTSMSAASGSGSSGTDSDNPRYKVTASTGVNIRKGAGEKYKVIGKLPYGTIVEVHGFYSSWAKISYSGKTGYIKGSNLKSVGGGSGSSSASSSSSAAKKSSGAKSDTKQVQTGKGLKISAVIVLRNGNNDGRDIVLDCGQFELDSIDAQGPPATVTIKATSLSYSNTVRQTLKSKSWENITLSEIAGEIARQNRMGVLFESGYNPKYSRVEQYRTSDIAFLQKLCHNAGCSLKATNNILVVFDQAAYEGKKAVKKIKYGKEGGYTKYKLSTGTNNCYTSCRVSYTTTSGTVISATEYADNYNENSDNQQCLQVRQRVSSKAEAQELAHKLLRLHNKFEITGTFTFPGDPKLAAGNTVELCDFGFGDGKYIIKTAKHSISSGGYTTQVTLRKCLSESESTSGGKADSDDEIQQLAMQVIRGEWDVYPKRKELLEAAGHSYEQVQARVNQILYGG